MPDRNHSEEPSREYLMRENAALKKRLEWFSGQLFGRVMPGLFAIPHPEEEDFPSTDVPDDFAGDTESRRNAPGVLHETGAAYHVSAPTSVPPDFPSDEATLELPSAERVGMSVAGFEQTTTIAARPAIVLRTIRRTLYVSNDGSGIAAAAFAPAVFPDPSGGPFAFDASFVASIAELNVAGMAFGTISERMKTEHGLAISGEALRELVLAAAETIAPVCSAMVTRTLPDWMNLRRMLEETKAGGDWLADGFLEMIHMLRELEEHAVRRAERLGGSPEDLYRERRFVRLDSARIVARFFGLCRETLPTLDTRSPLAETLRHAIEHESVLSGFLYDPRLELSRANPETPVADPFAALAICADECRMRGVQFRAWLEHTLTLLKQPDPPSPESLFPG